MTHKKLLLGITGSIAAYKSPELVRLFQQNDCEVICIFSPHAHEFVTALTLETLSQNPVMDSFHKETQFKKTQHVDLADWADGFLVAPATANFIAKAAHGIADDILTTIAISVNCPQIIAPAMNDRMWENSLVQENLQKLIHHQWHLINPMKGYLACDREGMGRLADLNSIVAEVLKIV